MLNKERQKMGQDKFNNKALWNVAPKSNTNLAFKTPGDEVPYNGPELWKHQEDLPTSVLPRVMVEKAVEIIWHREIFGKDENVDYQYNEIDKVMKEFDEKIEKCEKQGKTYNTCKRATIIGKQEAETFNKKTILWCIHYYL